MIIMFLFVTFITADYVVLRSGKVYRTAGKIRIEGDNVVFKVKGSDMEVTIPLYKVDIKKTKRANAPKTKKKTSDKPVKTFTNSDLKGSNKVTVRIEGSPTADGEEGEQSANPLLNVPDYTWENIATNDQEWFVNEVAVVQQRFAEAINYNRKIIGDYNNYVVEFNVQTPEEKANRQARLQELAQEVKSSKELIGRWYSAMETLLASGQNVDGIPEWVFQPLRVTLEENKDFNQ